MDFKTITFEKLAEETTARSQWTKIAAELHKEAKVGFLGRLAGQGTRGAQRAASAAKAEVTAAEAALAKAQTAAKKPAQKLTAAKGQLESLERQRAAMPLMSRIGDTLKTPFSKGTMGSKIKAQKGTIADLKAMKTRSGVGDAKKELAAAKLRAGSADDAVIKAREAQERARLGLGLGVGGAGLTLAAMPSGRRRGTVVVA